MLLCSASWRRGSYQFFSAHITRRETCEMFYIKNSCNTRRSGMPFPVLRAAKPWICLAPRIRAGLASLGRSAQLNNTFSGDCLFLWGQQTDNNNRFLIAQAKQLSFSVSVRPSLPAHHGGTKTTKSARFHPSLTRTFRHALLTSDLHLRL